jgi:CBS domain-containing protein
VQGENFLGGPRYSWDLKKRRKPMKVRDVMVGTPVWCSFETNLGAAVEKLWNQNCGILPIVDAQEKVVGVVTDRDICIALGTRNRLPGEITVGEVTTTGKLYSCKPDDDIRTALQTMGEKKVRRLPVMNVAGKLEGILSMDDIVLHADARNPELSYEDVVRTLKKLYSPQLPELVQQRAARA